MNHRQGNGGKMLSEASSAGKIAEAVHGATRVTQPADLPAFEKWWFEYRAKVSNGLQNTYSDFDVAGKQ